MLRQLALGGKTPIADRAPEVAVVRRRRALIGRFRRSLRAQRMNADVPAQVVDTVKRALTLRAMERARFAYLLGGARIHLEPVDHRAGDHWFLETRLLLVLQQAAPVQELAVAYRARPADVLFRWMHLSLRCDPLDAARQGAMNVAVNEQLQFISERPTTRFANEDAGRCAGPIGCCVEYVNR